MKRADRVKASRGQTVPRGHDIPALFPSCVLPLSLDDLVETATLELELPRQECRRLVDAAFTPGDPRDIEYYAR